jgi:hypothetical protein
MQEDRTGTRSVAVDPDWLVVSRPVRAVALVAVAPFGVQEPDAGPELEVLLDAFSTRF